MTISFGLATWTAIPSFYCPNPPAYPTTKARRSELPVEHGGIALAGGAFAAANEWGEPWPSGSLEWKTFFGVNQTAGVLAGGAAWSEPLLVEQRRGKGIAAYIDIDLGQTYLDQPDERLARFIADWLARQVPPPITLDGPWCAILEAYAWSPSEWRVHLDNNRSRVHRSWRNAPDALAPVGLRQGTENRRFGRAC